MMQRAKFRSWFLVLTSSFFLAAFSGCIVPSLSDFTDSSNSGGDNNSGNGTGNTNGGSDSGDTTDNNDTNNPGGTGTPADLDEVTGVNLSASALTLTPGGNSTLTAAVLGTGTYDTGINWTLISGGGSLQNNSNGTVTYTAPSVSQNTDVVIRATSRHNSSRSAVITLVVNVGVTFANNHPRIYINDNKTRLQAMLSSNLTVATRFKSAIDSRLGSTWTDLQSSGFSLWQFALLGQLTGDAQYCAKAITLLDQFVSGEETRIATLDPNDRGSMPEVSGDSYLETGHYIGDIALVYDWCFDHPSLTSAMKTRWLAYANQTVWNVWNHEHETWGAHNLAQLNPQDPVLHWSGWSIDNPVNNYYYSFLRATMLLGLAALDEIPDAEGWVTKFRYEKIQNQLVPTFNSDLIGGGSREGAGYGTAMMNLFELYDVWESSTGEDISQLTPHTRSSLLNMIHMVVPTRNRISLVGDHARDQTAAFFDYHRHYIQTLSYLLRSDPVLAPRGYWLIDHSSVTEMGSSFMRVYDFLYANNNLVTPAALTGLNTAYYASGTGQTYLRSSWDTTATWVQFTAGPYTESHAHQDQGSFLIYKGEWLAYDENYNFHSGLGQETPFHNLVKIVHTSNAPYMPSQPVRQWEGAVSTVQAVTQGALPNGENWFHIATDNSPIYQYRDDNYPSQVTAAQREMVYIEPDVVVVFDRVNSVSGTQQVWQLNSPKQPTVAGTRATFTGNVNTLKVDRILPTSGVTTSVFNWHTSSSDYDDGYRLDETVAGGDNKYLHVLSINNSVSSVAASDAGGLVGVEITLADGRTATVRFSPLYNGTPGQLIIQGGGITTVSTTLSRTVHTLPEQR